jgi:hypothetical protein
LPEQDTGLHSELQGLIAALEQELELEMQSPTTADAAEQQERQAARDALKHVLVDLKQQDAELEELIGGRALASVQRDAQGAPAAANVGEPPTGRDVLDGQAADMRDKISDLRRQNDALQRQNDVLQHEVAEHQQELAQRTADLAQRTHDLLAARAEAEKLQEVVETLRREQASLVRQMAEVPQMIVTESARPVAPTQAPPPKRPMPVRQPSRSTPTPRDPPPARPIPMWPSAMQQLQSARQWLSVGRPDQARRLLATVQTQMVFMPMTPEQSVVLDRNASATDVGDAIRWLDIGAMGEAMRSITRAIESSARTGG